MMIQGYDQAAAQRQHTAVSRPRRQRSPRAASLPFSEGMMLSVASSSSLMSLRISSGDQPGSYTPMARTVPRVADTAAGTAPAQGRGEV